MSTKVSSKFVFGIVYLILAMILLALLFALSVRPVGAAYDNQCDDKFDTPYLRDLNETIEASDATFSVCTGFSNVRPESDANTLILKVATKGAWGKFTESEEIRDVSFGVRRVYHLAMEREFNAYDDLPVYDEDGIFVYYTYSAGHYLYRWYVLKASDSCDVLYPSRDEYMIAGDGQYPLCFGAFVPHQTEDTFRVMVRSKFVFDELNNSRQPILWASIFKYRLGFMKAWTDLTEEELAANMNGEGFYFWYERSADSYDLLWYENWGRAFQSFFPITINHR